MNSENNKFAKMKFFVWEAIRDLPVLKDFFKSPSCTFTYWYSLLYHLSEAVRMIGDKRDLRKAENSPDRLLIVLRTSDFVQHCNASRDLDSIGIGNKHDVIRYASFALRTAVWNFLHSHGEHSLKLIIVEDRLSDDGREFYKNIAPDTTFVKSAPGNRETFQCQVDEAMKHADKRTVVCFLEDDYWLAPQSLIEIFDLFDKYNVAGFNPHFHPAVIDRGEKVRLYHVAGKFYCETKTTCCTFFITESCMRKSARLLRRYRGKEVGTINEIWRHNLCMMPCCRTLAEHLHLADMSYIWRATEGPKIV